MVDSLREAAPALTALSAEWVETEGAFAALGAEWNALLGRSRANRVFLTWEWVSVWWRHFGEGRDLRVLALRDAGGALRGIAPLYAQTRGSGLGRHRRIAFIGHGADANPDHLNFVFESGFERACLDAVLDAFLARPDDWDLLKLTDLCEEAPECALLVDAAVSRRLRLHRFLDNVCPYLPLPATFEEVFASLRPSLRRDIRKAQRRMEGEFEAEFLSFNRPDEVGAGLEILSRLHQMRMEDSGRGGNFRRETYHAFHRDVMAALAPRGWLELRVLRLDGVDVAANYALRYDGVLYGYQMGLHPEYYKLSPGTLLLSRMAEDLVGEGFREIDMLRGRSVWKYRWTSLERRDWSFLVERPGWRGRRGYVADLLDNRPGLILKRVLPERAFVALQGWARKRRARRGGEAGP